MVCRTTYSAKEHTVKVVAVPILTRLAVVMTDAAHLQIRAVGFSVAHPQQHAVMVAAANMLMLLAVMITHAALPHPHAVLVTNAAHT